MPYRSKEKQREAVLRAVRKSRGITEGITVIPKVTQDVIPAEPTVLQGVLQDEKRINAIKKEINNQLCAEIEAICVYFKDKRPDDTRLARFERALEYNTWLLKNPKPTRLKASQPGI